MSLGAAAVFNSVKSHALASGLFPGGVNTHEPKSAPSDAHCAIYVSDIRPVPQGSGLTKTTAVLDVMARVYVRMLQEPQDAIDPNIVAVTDKFMEDLSGDFELGGNARNIDLLGQSGKQLSARAGYIQIDSTMFRSMDITIPIIVSDAFTQAP